MWDEVIRDTAVDDHTKMMITLAVLISLQGADEYHSIVKGAYELGISPVEIRKITSFKKCGYDR